jgi:hypothetical protein
MIKLLAIVAVVLGGCNLYFNQPSNNPPISPPISPPGGGGGGIGVPDAGFGGPDAAFTGPGGVYAEFVQNVYPILSTQCLGCHLGAPTNPLALFGSAADPNDVYTAVIDDPALTGCWVPGNSELLTKGAHEGPPLSQTEQGIIVEWLNDESVATGGTAPGCTSPNDPALLAEEAFAACETVSGSDIIATGVVAELNNLQSSAGTCGSCHAPGGAGGFYLGSAAGMLSAWETQVGLEAVFAAEENPAGTFVVAFDSAVFVDKGAEQQNGTGTHPSFAVPQALLTDMASFVTDIDTLENENVCPPPAFY